MHKKLLALYGLKWNPFSPELPSEALWMTPKIESFAWRIEQAHRIARRDAEGHAQRSEPHHAGDHR